MGLSYNRPALVFTLHVVLFIAALFIWFSKPRFFQYYPSHTITFLFWRFFKSIFWTYGIFKLDASTKLKSRKRPKIDWPRVNERWVANRWQFFSKSCIFSPYYWGSKMNTMIKMWQFGSEMYTYFHITFYICLWYMGQIRKCNPF